MRKDRDRTLASAAPSSAEAALSMGTAAPRETFTGVAGAHLEQTDSRERFLSRVGDLLSSSLDYRETIQSVARLCTAFLAEYCIVHVEEAGEVRALGIAHSDARREPGLRDILRLLPIGSSSRNPVVDVLRTGRTCLMAHVGDAELSSLTGASPHGVRLRELGLTSVLIVPLTARGHTLGAISLARSGAAPAYTVDDAATVEELARRAALPVDNARLYHEARREARARDRTLGVVSHDLRNALNSALMHSDLLLDLPAAELVAGKGRKQIMGLRRSLEHMQRLVQDLLDVENIEKGRLSLHLQPMDLRALAGEVDEMFAPLARERGIRWSVHLPEMPVPPRADHVRIVQVISNLVMNALDFTPVGGRIAIVGVVDETVVRFCVEDDGAGISEEDLPHVFDRHWRGGSPDRRSAGSGLGLTIVRGLVQAHGGECWVHSNRGEGSSFYFTLPVPA